MVRGGAWNLPAPLLSRLRPRVSGSVLSRVDNVGFPRGHRPRVLPGLPRRCRPMSAPPSSPGRTTADSEALIRKQEKPQCPTKRSRELFAESKRYFPGGVNSPVRAFRAVGGQPVFISRAEGTVRIYGADDTRLHRLRRLVGTHDPGTRSCGGGQGPAGAGCPRHQLRRAHRPGAGFWVAWCRTAYPSMEMMRFVSSGTEATMSAIRVARGATGRPAIVKSGRAAITATPTTCW